MILDDQKADMLKVQVRAVAGNGLRTLLKTVSTAFSPMLFSRDCCQYCCQAAGQDPSRADNPGTSAQHMTGNGRS
jgi:hypothetical protein